MEADERDTVRVLLTALGVPDEVPKIVLVNGQHAMENYVLRNGDIVSVFPPLIGGRSSRAH
jgi:sulfur carrier protein ThiS